MEPFQPLSSEDISQAFDQAQHRYRRLGIDASAAIDQALKAPISLHCWQGDDVGGFEVQEDPTAGGGIMATGNFPGRARNGEELRADLDQVLSLLPGAHKVNLHAIYAETDGACVDRDQLKPEHFSAWISWAKQRGIGLDFNPTFFAHPKANDGFTLSHADDSIRDFWIQHGVACRKIAEHMGKELDTPCVINHWIPDGAKDLTADRWGPRARLEQSLDAMLDASHGVDTRFCRDAVESKLFGIGSEEFVVGSAEFYQAYALSRNILYCLDMGHFHPTETIHGKLSSLLTFHKHVLLHVSRPIRWDSDHVVIFNDDLKNVFHELVRGQAVDRAFVALDFFDASINRTGAYVIGTRAARKALLYALLEPVSTLQELEAAGQGAEKLGLMEELKTMPFGAVWDELCRRADVPVGSAWINEMQHYANTTLALRS